MVAAGGSRPDGLSTPDVHGRRSGSTGPLSELIKRWLPIARSQPAAAGALSKLDWCASPAWQATTGLQWVEELIAGNFAAVALSIARRASKARDAAAKRLRLRKCHDFETDLGDIAVRQPITRRSNKINMSCGVRPYSVRPGRQRSRARLSRRSDRRSLPPYLSTKRQTRSRSPAPLAAVTDRDPATTGRAGTRRGAGRRGVGARRWPGSGRRGRARPRW
jgi:hypothetical protein